MPSKKILDKKFKVKLFNTHERRLMLLLSLMVLTLAVGYVWLDSTFDVSYDCRFTTKDSYNKSSATEKYTTNLRLFFYGERCVF